MSKIVINFEPNYYILHTSNYSENFTYNDFFFLNLDTKEIIIINSVDKFRLIMGCKYFCIFTFNFMGLMDIFMYLKSNFKLNFIDLSLQCFWIMVFKEGSYCEKISIDLNSLTIEEIEINNQSQDLNIDLEKEMAEFERKVENYKNNLFLKSLVDVKDLKNNLQEHYKLLITSYNENNKNINILKKMDLKEVPILLKGKHKILDDIKELKLTSEKHDILITEKKDELNYLEQEIVKKKFFLSNLVKEEKQITNINQGNINQGNINQGNINQGNINQGNINQGNINQGNIEKELAIFIHINSIEMWDDIKLFLDNLRLVDINIDLYVNFSEELNNELEKYLNLKKEISEIEYFDTIYFTESKQYGIDVVGFLNSYTKMLNLQINYESIIKIHSKTNKKWLTTLLYSLLGNSKIIQKNFDYIKNENVGMIGYTTFNAIDFLSKDSGCYKNLGIYLNFFEINITNNSEFIPGRIFWVKDEILRKYLTHTKIIHIINSFNSNIESQSNINGKIEAFERLFGIFVKSEQKDIISIEDITS
jgi:hypothetical protein